MSEPSTAAPVDLRAFLQRAERSIPTIAIPAWIVRVIFTRGGDRPSRRWIVWILTGLILIVVQIGVEPRFEVNKDNGPWTADIWVVLFSLLVIYGLWCPKRTWARFIDASPAIAELLGSNVNITLIEDWLRKCLKKRVQYFLPIAGSALAILALSLTEKVISQNVWVDGGSYVAIAAIGFVATSGFFWVVALTVLVNRIVSCNDLRLIWHDPIHSPGVNEISRLLAGVFVISMLGAALVSAAILTASEGQRNIPEHIFVYFLLGLAFVSLTFVGVAPQVWLSSALHKRRRDTLRMVDRQFVSEVEQIGSQPLKQISDQIAFYAQLSQASSSTIRLEVVAVYVGAALTGLAPFLFQLIVHG